MDYTKEPEGIDLNLTPMLLSDEDRQEIREIIAEYKKSGKIPKNAREQPKTAQRKLPGAFNKSETLTGKVPAHKKVKARGTGKQI